MTWEAKPDRTTATLSQTVRVTLSVEGLAPLRVEQPDDVLDDESAPAWHVRPAGEATVTALPGGRQRWERVYRADPYVLGQPVKLGFAPARAFAGAAPQPTAVPWPALSVRVEPSESVARNPERVEPATGIEDLPGLVRPADPRRAWGVALAAVTLVAAAACAAAWVVRRRRPVPPSPAEWAARELDALERDDPDGVAFADRLSDILRTFVERRSGLPATRRTTAELLAVAEPGALPLDAVRQVLEACDGAKFAGREPSPDERRRLLADCRECTTNAPPMPPQ